MSHSHKRVDDPAAPPPGMTQEQLEWFAAETERAAEKGAKRGVAAQARRGTIAFVVLLVCFGLNLYLLNRANDARDKASNQGREAIVTSGRAVSVDGCNRDYADRVKFRNLLLRLKVATQANPGTSAAQRKAGVEFYDRELNNYPLLDCRAARKLITDDPARIPRNPDPFYKGNPHAPKEVRLPKPGG